MPLDDAVAASASTLVPDLLAVALDRTVADERNLLRTAGVHGPPGCPSGASPDLLPVLRL